MMFEDFKRMKSIPRDMVFQYVFYFVLVILPQKQQSPETPHGLL